MGLEIGFEQGFVEDACEQPLRSDWLESFNAVDAKAFAIADLVAKNVARGECSLATDVLLLALGRHIGRAYANADCRRDDGWLHPAALARTVEQIRAEPTNSIPLHQMASSAGLGISAFVRAFRGSVGTTPAAFAMRVRLGNASQMLLSTDLALRDIAAATGFSSASHLGRAFRAHYGVTPHADKRNAADRLRDPAMVRNPRKRRP